jgi:hypothetical protein
VERGLACEAVVNRETSSPNVPLAAALYRLEIETGPRLVDVVLTGSGNSPNPQLNRRDAECK